MYPRMAALVVVGAVVLLGSTMTAPASISRSAASCGSMAGPKWENPAFGKEGSTWKVSAKGVPCSFAKTWAAKLMKTLWRGEAGTKLRGPAGWSCLPTFASTVSTKGTPGSCRKGSKTFFWAPSV